MAGRRSSGAMRTPPLPAPKREERTLRSTFVFARAVTIYKRPFLSCYKIKSQLGTESERQLEHVKNRESKKNDNVEFRRRANLQKEVLSDGAWVLF